VWNFGNGSSLNSCATVVETFEEGLYDVSLTVTDSYGCTNSQTFFDYIEVISFPEASFYVNNTNLSSWDTEVEFVNTSLNASVFEWDFGDNSSAEFIENPVHIFPDALNQSYSITLTATNEFGCSDEATLVITVRDELIFYIPNSFTPDGNSFNQSFQPIFTSGYDPYDFHLTIFNRWGEVLFESYDASVGWEGTYAMGKIAEDGVYIWQIEFKESMSNKRHHNDGHVTLLR
jgi:gliding motility-associated-like protein